MIRAAEWVSQAAILYLWTITLLSGRENRLKKGPLPQERFRRQRGLGEQDRRAPSEDLASVEPRPRNASLIGANLRRMIAGLVASESTRVIVAQRFGKCRHIHISVWPRTPSTYGASFPVPPSHSSILGKSLGTRLADLQVFIFSPCRGGPFPGHA